MDCKRILENYNWYESPSIINLLEPIIGDLFIAHRLVMSSRLIINEWNIFSILGGDDKRLKI